MSRESCWPWSGWPWSCVVGVPLLVSIALLAWAQSPPSPHPSCEQALEAQYRLLVSDKLLTDTPGTPWPQQLMAVVTQLRTTQTLHDIKKTQAELAERNVAQLLEQSRQAQLVLTGQNAELRQEVEALKQQQAESPKN